MARQKENHSLSNRGVPWQRRVSKPDLIDDFGIWLIPAVTSDLRGKASSTVTGMIFVADFAVNRLIVERSVSKLGI